MLATAATGACAGGPPTVGPSGVDGLVVPTPSPRPDDFTGRVDNPWFPLVPGTVRTYRATTAHGPRTVTVTVTGRARLVAGVRTVVVHEAVTDPRGRRVAQADDWYAQDRAGNVWSFGTAGTSYDGGQPDTHGSWQAGVDGAEPGLAMPAHPRLGDGYVREHAPGVAVDQAEVLDLAATRALAVGADGTEGAAGVDDRLLETADTSPLEPGRVQHTFYAQGVGLVEQDTVTGGTERVELTGVRSP
jgi:hypothetical protein